MVTWEVKARQMGLQKKDLAKTMVAELGLTCTPDMYLQETEKLHHTLFPDVSWYRYIIFNNIYDIQPTIIILTHTSIWLF